METTQPTVDLSGWTYLLTFGYSLDIYDKGNRRIGVDRDTGRVEISYTVKGASPLSFEGEGD